ncbi:MAG: hemolysin family protein [Caulobacterales bacterium]|nr:hemolysin family protein [Caulobacterales bacterium]
MPDAAPSPRWLHRLRGVFHREVDEPEPVHAHVNGDADPRRRAASRARLRNAERFDSLRVVDVMVPRADIVALEVDTPLGEVARLFAEAAHSRVPVYRESLDEPIGVVHIKDVMRHLAPGVENGTPLAERRVLAAAARPALYVPPSMPASDLLLKMQSRRIHMALVVDEFGGTDGLVTLEDLLEEIVGDIEDEHDIADAPTVRMRGPRVWDADARVSIEDLGSFVDRPLALADMTEEVETLGGLVFALAGRVPERGEVIRHPAGVDFEVADADPRRIKRLMVRVIDRPEEAPAEDAGSASA